MDYRVNGAFTVCMDCLQAPDRPDWLIDCLNREQEPLWRVSKLPSSDLVCDFERGLGIPADIPADKDKVSE